MVELWSTNMTVSVCRLFRRMFILSILVFSSGLSSLCIRRDKIIFMPCVWNSVSDIMLLKWVWTSSK